VGHQYHVFGIALDTVHKEGEMRASDGALLSHMLTVLYGALYPIDDLKDRFGEYPTFTRTLDSFTALVPFEGKMVPRFTYVGPVDDAGAG
jgi:hypothetical protein